MSGATLVACLLALINAPLLAEMPDHHLEPCPRTPNCVSTQETRESHRMDPIAYDGDLEEARRDLLELLAGEPRVEVTETGDRVIRAVFTTRLMRFKDDVVFLFDPEAKVIHFRSASRIGRSDWGANRERMEHLSRLFAERSEVTVR